MNVYSNLKLIKKSKLNNKERSNQVIVDQNNVTQLNNNEVNINQANDHLSSFIRLPDGGYYKQLVSLEELLNKVDENTKVIDIIETDNAKEEMNTVLKETTGATLNEQTIKEKIGVMFLEFIADLNTVTRSAVLFS